MPSPSSIPSDAPVLVLPDQEEIARFCRTHHLMLMVLFGSHVSGVVTSRSDVDIAIRRDGSPGRESALTLLHALAGLFHTDRVDLVDLEQASPLLACEALVYGKPLYQAAPDLFDNARAYAVKLCRDTRKFRALQETYLDRFLHPSESQTMTAHEKTTRKLVTMTTYLAELDHLKDCTLEAYRDDFLIRRSVERLLQLLVESATDICDHLIVTAGHPPAENHYESFIDAGRYGIIPEDLALALAPSAGLRNILVHAYETIDDTLVHGSVKEALTLFPQFIAAIRGYVKACEDGQGE